jgi:superfamily II DNA/RNA helicase
MCSTDIVICCLQVLLCTATMPQAVTAAAAEWLQKPADCRVTGGDGAAAISPTVTQVCSFNNTGQSVSSRL